MAARRTWTWATKLAIHDHGNRMKALGYNGREIGDELAANGVDWDKGRVSTLLNDKRASLVAKVEAEAAECRKKRRKVPPPPVFPMPAKLPEGTARHANGAAANAGDDPRDNNPNYWKAQHEKIKVKILLGELIRRKETRAALVAPLSELASGIEELPARVLMLAPNTPENTMAVLRKVTRALAARTAGIDPEKLI